MSLNPAYKNADLQNNELVIKSTGAMVSQFVAPQKKSVLYPKWSKRHMRNIENTT
jgi:hypothetical protein